MNIVTIQIGHGSYDAIIGRSLLGKIGELVRPIFPGARCAIVSDANVAPLFEKTIGESLQRAGFATEAITIAAGEETKSLANVAELCDQLSAAGLDRSSFLVSLGGGVVGDLAGFVAAIYLRGIPYISVPTTLLAQIDSSIGGKTGVNSAAGKNLIGCFHHPTLVIADTDALRSLPERIWHEGFAEVIKHGIIRDAELFEKSAQLDLESLVERNVALKAAIVSEDEREQTGERSLLNFGHTIGHAIEHAAGYGTLLHGEAISLGIVAAARISVRRAGLSLGACEQIVAALETHRLPTSLPPNFPRDKIFAALARDKKFANGQIRFVVAHKIGHASVTENVTMDDLRAAVAEL